MREFFRVMGVMVVGAGVCTAQAAPPLCPARPAKPGVSVQEEVPRPTVGAVEATIAAEVADPSVILAAEPIPNFGVARYRLADYAECLGTIGCYWTDLKVQTERAERALEGLVASKKAGEKLAMVLDIDETSLSNYCEMKREDFGYIGELYGEWMESAEGLPIQGTLQ